MADLHNETHYEATDVKVGPVVLASLLLFVLTLIVMIAVNVAMGVVQTQQAEAEQVAEPAILLVRPTVPAPRLQPNPIDNRLPMEDMILLREREDDILLNYQWIDQANGIVRMPIDVAIDVVAEEGLPMRDVEN